VPADNAFAVAAGIAFFGESKFLAGFEYNVPALNNPGRGTFEYSVYDTLLDPARPLSKADAKKHRIYTQKVDLRSYAATPVNATPLTLYSMLPGGPFVPASNKGSRLIGSRWTIFSMYEAYFPDSQSANKNIGISWGSSDHPMNQGMRKILGRTPGPAAAVLISNSPPAAAETVTEPPAVSPPTMMLAVTWHCGPAVEPAVYVTEAPSPVIVPQGATHSTASGVIARPPESVTATETAVLSPGRRAAVAALTVTTKGPA